MHSFAPPIAQLLPQLEALRSVYQSAGCHMLLLTLLREPVALARSAFHWYTHNHFAIGQPKVVIDALRNATAVMQDNLLTRYILDGWVSPFIPGRLSEAARHYETGHRYEAAHRRPFRGELSLSDLHKASAVLRAFDVVGLLEQTGAFLHRVGTLLQSALGLPLMEPAETIAGCMYHTFPTTQGHYLEHPSNESLWNASLLGHELDSIMYYKAAASWSANARTWSSEQTPGHMSTCREVQRWCDARCCKVVQNRSSAAPDFGSNRPR